MNRSLAVLVLISMSERAAIAAQPCTGPLGPIEVVRCALEQSPEVRIANAELRALEGRRQAARTILPSNPVVSFSASARRASALEPTAANQTFFNWYLTLAQEVEIGGQRGTRLQVVAAEAQAASRQLAVVRQEVAASALIAFYELWAAAKAAQLAEEVDAVAQKLGEIAKARLSEALISPVDGDLATAEALRMRLARFEAQRRYAFAQSTLAVLLGNETARPVDLPDSFGSYDLKSLEGYAVDSLVEQALQLRGEVKAAESEQLVNERQLTLLRRLRIPSPTLSLFAQRDGLDEQVYGGGVSLPIPLPAPLGRTGAGEIAQANARIDQQRVTVERVRLRVRLEVERAFAEEKARAASQQALSEEFLARVRADLGVLGEGIAARQLSLREALFAQRSLIETLQSALEARLAYARAWVELRRAAGLPLPGVTQ